MLCQKKWCYRVLLILGMLVLGGCGKDRKNVSESAYSVKEEAYSSNYSCKDKDGRNIFTDNKDKFGISEEGYYFMAGIIKHIKGKLFRR